MVILQTDHYRYTVTSVEKTKQDIKNILKKFGINKQRWTELDPKQTYVEFIIEKQDGVSIMVRMNVPYVEEQSRTRGKYYDEKRSFRILFYYLKGLLTSRDAEILTVEQTFMPHTVLGDGRTMAEKFQEIVDSGDVPALEGFDFIPNKNDKPKKLLLNKKVEEVEE